MRIALLAVPVVLFSSLTSLAFRQQPALPVATPIATISTSRIVSESAEGKAGLAKLQALQQARAEDLRTKTEKLEATRLRLATADAAARTQLQAEADQERADLDRATVQAQTEVQ